MKSVERSQIHRHAGGMGLDPADVEQVVALVGRDLTASLGFPSETAEGIARREALNAAEVMHQWDDDEVSYSFWSASWRTRSSGFMTPSSTRLGQLAPNTGITLCG